MISSSRFLVFAAFLGSAAMVLPTTATVTMMGQVPGSRLGTTQTQRTRPLQWGVSGITAEIQDFCTIGGYLCSETTNDVYAITNGHCVVPDYMAAAADESQCLLDGPLLQPSPTDGGNSLADAVSVAGAGSAWCGYQTGDHFEDWAAFRLSDDQEVAMKIAGAPPGDDQVVTFGETGTQADFGISLLNTPGPEVDLYKAGRTTGFTQGSTSCIRSDPSSLIFCGGLSSPTFSNAGDSGSFVFIRAFGGGYKPIGLHSAVTEYQPIDEIEENVSRKTGDTLKVCTAARLESMGRLGGASPAPSPANESPSPAPSPVPDESSPSPAPSPVSEDPSPSPAPSGGGDGAVDIPFTGPTGDHGVDGDPPGPSPPATPPEPLEPDVTPAWVWIVVFVAGTAAVVVVFVMLASVAWRIFHKPKAKVPVTDLEAAIPADKVPAGVIVDTDIELRHL